MCPSSFYLLCTADDHLPDDFVPPSDFDLPLDAENGRDAAAAAIACSGLFELGQYNPMQFGPINLI